MFWFKRKQRNRRFTREHVLEVKLRSSQVHAARVRLAAMALGLLFAAVLGIYAVVRGGKVLLDVWVYDNPSFAIQEIDVQTDGVVATDQLRRWAGVKPGQNLLALDLARVKRDLEMVPVVQSASVERLLPHTLRLRVLEREPLAQIILPKPRPGGGATLAVFYVDKDGCVMSPLDPRHRAASAPADSAEQLPQLTGVNPNEVQAGRRIDTPQVRAALDLVAAFERSPLTGLVELKTIDVSPKEVLLVATSQGGEVTLGLRDLDRQLQRWRQVLDLGQRSGKAIASLDLAITNNVPAKWLEASAAPPLSPKNPKALRTRKKHV